MRDGEGVNLYIANGKTLAGLNGLDAAEPLAESFRKNSLERAQRWLRYVKRGLPHTQNLREPAAVVRVFVGDQDGIEPVEILFDGGEARQSFALAQPRVHEEAGAFGLEQRDVARTSGRENGNTQADGNAPAERHSKTKLQTWKMMAEREHHVNGSAKTAPSIRWRIPRSLWRFAPP